MVLAYNMFCQGFSVIVFSLKEFYDIFVIVQTSSEMLSIVYCWDYCWKCEFDTDAQIERTKIISMM